MNVLKYLKCALFKHDVSGSKSIANTFASNNWIKRCNCCGRYVMHGHLGSISLSEEEAFRIKSELDEIFGRYREIIYQKQNNG